MKPNRIISTLLVFAFTATSMPVLDRHCEAGEVSRSNLRDCFPLALLGVAMTKLAPPSSFENRARLAQKGGPQSQMEEGRKWAQLAEGAVLLLSSDPASAINRGTVTAIARLGPQPAQACISYLMRLWMETPNEAIKDAVIGVLGEIGQPTFDFLTRIVRDRTAPHSVRTASYDIFAALGEPAVSVSIGLLQDPDRALRIAATYILSRMGRKAAQAVPALKKASQEDSDEMVKEKASVSLRDILRDQSRDVPSTEKRRGGFTSYKLPLLIVGSAVIAFALPALLPYIAAPFGDAIAAILGTGGALAVAPVGGLGDQAAGDGGEIPMDLQKLLSSPEVLEKAKILRRAAQPDLIVEEETEKIKGLAIEELVDILKDDSVWWIKRAAAALLVGNRGPQAVSIVPTLLEILENTTDGFVREYLLKALGKISQPAELVIPALIEALDHDRWLVRRDAADALGATGRAGVFAIPALKKALKDKEWLVRESANESIQKITAISRSLSDTFGAKEAGRAP